MSDTTTELVRERDQLRADVATYRDHRARLMQALDTLLTEVDCARAGHPAKTLDTARILAKDALNHARGLRR